MTTNPIPEDLSVLVITKHLIVGNKSGLLVLLSAIASALSDGGGVGEFLDPNGDAFDVNIKTCDDFEQLENSTRPQIDDQLEPLLKELINRHSLLLILKALKTICIQANENNPNFDWDTDANAIAAMIEKVEN